MAPTRRGAREWAKGARAWAWAIRIAASLGVVGASSEGVRSTVVWSNSTGGSSHRGWPGRVLAAGLTSRRGARGRNQQTHAPHRVTRGRNRQTHAPDRVTRGRDQPTHVPDRVTPVRNQPTHVPDRLTLARSQPTHVPDRVTRGRNRPTHFGWHVRHSPPAPDSLPSSACADRPRCMWTLLSDGHARLFATLMHFLLAWNARMQQGRRSGATRGAAFRCRRTRSGWCGEPRRTSE